MNTENTAIQSAYELIKQHNKFMADRLIGELRFAGNDLKRMKDRRREREAEYRASLWQRLTFDEFNVLRPFDYAIEDKQTLYYSCENDIINEAERIDNKINSRKESEIEEGNFVYYIVDLDTNVRKTEDGVPVIYSMIEAAEYGCSEEFDRVISIAEYNRRYGAFM